jgi:hypothetical protein
MEIYIKQWRDLRQLSEDELLELVNNNITLKTK